MIFQYLGHPGARTHIEHGINTGNILFIIIIRQLSEQIKLKYSQVLVTSYSYNLLHYKLALFPSYYALPLRTSLFYAP